LPAGSFAQKIKVRGVEGYYRTYRPAGAPLVVMLHPSGGSAGQTERDYHWDAEADRGHFVVAYPDWADYAGANDVDLISAIVAAIERHNPVDSGRVYAAGISRGGIEAYYLVCSTAIFAAIGVDSATELATCPHPAPAWATRRRRLSTRRRSSGSSSRSITANPRRPKNCVDST
jgi:polyhydroxybutyrate depolymerase